MLRNVKEISGYTLRGVDDEIGAVKDFLFDDRLWIVRYLVADTNKWLPASQKVLISPIALGEPDVQNNVLPVALSRDQIEDSPPLESDLPVSRQYEERLLQYYGYGYYWMGPQPWGISSSPLGLVDRDLVSEAEEAKEANDPNLRSMNEVMGYHIHAKDTSIGHVIDFILDGEQWQVVSLVINTRNWWPGGRDVIISPKHIKSVDWKARSVYVDLTAQQIKEGKEFNADEFTS